MRMKKENLEKPHIRIRHLKKKLKKHTHKFIIKKHKKPKMKRIERIKSQLSTANRSSAESSSSKDDSESYIRRVVVLDAVRTPICRANKVCGFLFSPFSSLFFHVYILSYIGYIGCF